MAPTPTGKTGKGKQGCGRVGRSDPRHCNLGGSYYDAGYYGYGYGYPAYTYYPGYYDAGYYYSYPAGYYYYPAMAESGTSQQLAVLPQAPSLPAEGAESTVKANPGHLLTCGHALLLGGAMAACDLLSGNNSDVSFQENFQSKATAAAVRPRHRD